MSSLLTTSEAARILDRSSARVMQLADAGRLPVALRTRSGWRLFDEDAVKAFVRDRDREMELQPNG